MKNILADFLLKLAFALGARRVTVNVLRDAYTQAAADAVLTARPAWGDEEAAAVSRFLKSPAGELFSKRLRAVAAHVAIEGANDRAHTVHAAGVSAGWNECVRYLHSLSRVSRVEDTDGRSTGADVRSLTTEAAGAGAGRSHHGQAPEDGAQLLERLSP